MAANINSHFTFAHEKLQDSAIRNLGMVEDMIQDFKADIPKPDTLKQVLGTIGGGMYCFDQFIKESYPKEQAWLTCLWSLLAAGMAGVVAGRAGPAAAGDVFGLLAGVIGVRTNPSYIYCSSEPCRMPYFYKPA